ncbi:MAG: DNA-3-methyladenine glycosylase [Patescibacteria group bacterium]
MKIIQENINSYPAIIHLTKADKVLAEIINKVPSLNWEKGDNYFKSLVESIISQQLSGKAADTITKRFEKLFTKLPYTPQDILNFSDEEVRAVGISYGKVSYIKDLARKILGKELDFGHIHTFSDEDVILHLTQVKGIGRWTAEMFLMFSLGREDVFSYGDQGLKNAIQKNYRLKRPLSRKKIDKISSKWRPYRTWACRYLWRSLELE